MVDISPSTVEKVICSYETVNFPHNMCVQSFTFLSICREVCLNKFCCVFFWAYNIKLQMDIMYFPQHSALCSFATKWWRFKCCVIVIVMATRKHRANLQLPIFVPLTNRVSHHRVSTSMNNFQEHLEQYEQSLAKSTS